MNYITEAWAKLNYISENNLDEDLRGYFKNQYLNKFLQKMQETNPELFGRRMQDEDKNKKAYELALAIAKLDPTFKGRDIENPDEALNKDKGSYFDWLIRLINKGAASYEEVMRDAHEYTDQLRIFDDLKKRNRLPSDKKDIMRFKSLSELMSFIQELGATSDEEGNVKVSDFKNEIKDIRQGIATICKFDNPDNIPQEIQSVDDVMELLGESSEWEMWKAKNKYATMLFDSWGKGAGWCVGGMLSSPRNGEQQAQAAESYYNRYCSNGRDFYVCFQRKDKNAPRPDNKYLITLAEGGRLPEYGNYQFNDANNHTQYSQGFGNGYGEDAQMGALAGFLKEAGLVEAARKHLPELPALKIIDDLEKYSNGEPYIFEGEGEIPEAYRPFIKDIQFEFDGETRHINPVGHPEYFKARTVDQLVNVDRLVKGEPYEFNGTSIPEFLKEAIKVINITDDYMCQTGAPEGEAANTLGPNAILGIKNLETLNLTDKITAFKAYCIKNCNDTYKIIIPRFPDRKIKISPYADFIREHLYYDDTPNELALKPKAAAQPAE